MKPNVSGKHFTGAGGEVIERFRDCETFTNMTSGAQVVNARESAQAPAAQRHKVEALQRTS